MAAPRRYRLHAAAPAALVIAVLCLPLLSAAAAGDVEALAAACDARIAGLEQRLQLLQLASNLLVLVGAALAAGGAGLAGFTQHAKLRVVAAALAIFGALLCLSTTILPDRSSDRLRLTAADRQRTAGARARSAAGSRSEYAAARFAECASLTPSLDVPAPPSATAPATTAESLLIEPERVAPPAPAAAPARPAATLERRTPQRPRDFGF